MFQRRTPTIPLLWRVFGINALIVVVAGAVLVLSPATVSSPIRLEEAVTLASGIVVMLAVDLVLTRRSLASLDELASTMGRIDPLRPGARVELDAREREVSDLVRNFNEMLDRVETERRASAHREAAATDAEQRRIAGDLHDEIGQRLTVLLLMLANIQPDADPVTAGRIQEARDLAHGVLDDLRDVVHRLRPQALDELGVTNALAALAASLERGLGVPIERRLERLDTVIDPVVGLVIYRIAQEALTNAARHAPGSRIVLSLTRRPGGTIELRIADDGPGLSGPSGAGIRWMAERAVMIGAVLDVDGASPGTTVTLTVTPSEAGDPA